MGEHIIKNVDDPITLFPSWRHTGETKILAVNEIIIATKISNYNDEFSNVGSKKKTTSVGVDGSKIRCQKRRRGASEEEIGRCDGKKGQCRMGCGSS